MPTTARLEAPLPFPADPGEPLWQERRTVPVLAFYGVPIGFLVAIAIGVGSLPVRAALLAAAALVGWRLVVARRRSLLETYAVSERYLTVVQPGGGRIALPVDAIEEVRLRGDQVMVASRHGVVTLGFVRGQRRLVAALTSVAPTLAVEREVPVQCVT